VDRWLDSVQPPDVARILRRFHDDLSSHPDLHLEAKVRDQSKSWIVLRVSRASSRLFDVDPRLAYATAYFRPSAFKSGILNRHIVKMHFPEAGGRRADHLFLRIRDSVTAGDVCSFLLNALGSR
jgi:hypothetical protein